MNSNTIQLKRGKKETWEKLNPILAYGEPGFIKETGELKIGDGVTAWNNLQNITKESIPYINGNNASPPLILMDLKPGPYVLTGTFAYSNNSENGQIPFTNTLVQIDEISEGQKSVSFQVADEIICIFFTNDSYEFKRYCLADMGNGGGSVEGAVLYTPQTLTANQKAQARTNIGAVATVNGVAPDGNGNVVVETGGGTNEEVARMKADQPYLFSDLVQTGNLLDNSLFIEGKYVSSEGTLKTNASAEATEEYIDISKAVGTHLAMYKCNKTTLAANQTYWRMCFYDADKNKISFSENSSTNDLTKAIVEIPEGAVYIRLSYLKTVTAGYMVVRGPADMELPNFEPKKTFTVVPENLNEKLAEIDEIKQALETANTNTAQHQDDAEFTVTKLNSSNQFSQNDITFVGDELWVSKENATYYTNGTMIFRYKVVDGEFTLVGTCDCDFGHLNTMDYCAANDCLIFGNGGNGTETTGNYFVVVKNPLSLGETALIADVGIKYDVDVGYKVQALWGGSNLGDNNIVYLLSNNAANVTKVLLLKGDDGEFNGEFVTLEEHTLEAFGVQGADIFGDTLYIGGQLNGNEYAAVKEISLSDYTQTRIVKRKFYSSDGTAITACVQGVYVDADSVWLCVNSGDTNKPVCLTKYYR